jgi:formylglycine-generating enzyme required for sulfatase activity
MRSPTTVISSADLLRALQLAEPDFAAADRLAEGLGFYRLPAEVPPVDILIPPPDDGVKPPQPEPTQTQNPAKAPLRCSFLTITACEPLQQDTQTVPLPPADKPLSKQDCQPLESGPPPMPPLVRKQRLWPAVKRSLVVNRPSGIDIKRLTAQMARAEPAYRLPTLWRQWWSGELMVIWDRSERMAPYNMDYQSLLTQVLDGRGRSGLRLYTVDGLPRQVTGCWLSGTAVKAGHHIQPAACGAKVLILSDLGALSESPTAARHWQNFARDFRQTGAQLVAWVPHSARQVETATAQLIQIHCLDRQGNLQPQSGRLQTSQQRQTEHQRLHQLREQLLVRLAFCLRVEKELLRASRELHPALAAEPALEGLTWSYRPVVRASDISRPLAPAYQAAYRERFSTLTVTEQQAALDCALHVHAWQGRSTAVMETLIWESHVGAASETETAKPLVAQSKSWIAAFLVNQQTEGGTQEIIAFAEDMLSRNWQDETFQRRHSEWLAELWATSGQTEVPPGLEAVDVAKVKVSRPPQTYRLMQIGTHLMLWPLTKPAPAFATSGLNSPWLLDGLELISESPYCRRWLSPLGEPLLLADLTTLQSCTLIASGRRYAMTQLYRPTWANKIGRDRCGIFAEFELSTWHGTATQTLRWIEPGTFLMGSPDDEPERSEDEGPQHEVTISQGFWLADTACTQALWLAVMGGENPSRFQNDLSQPVEQVSWHQVQTFLQRLQTLLPDCQVDLPSEAEWEYACRAGTESPFSFGANISPQQVNYVGNHPYPGSKQGEYREKTVPVKSLPTNPWGLYEMHGNVYEWCKDGQRSYDQQAQIDPLGPMAGDDLPRVIRGGSWLHYAKRARSAARLAYLPGHARSILGFRVCLRSIESGQEGVGPAGSPGRASGASPDAENTEVKSSEKNVFSKVGSLFKRKSKPKR